VYPCALRADQLHRVLHGQWRMQERHIDHRVRHQRRRLQRLRQRVHVRKYRSVQAASDLREQLPWVLLG
jgi:hypothetical protein